MTDHSYKSVDELETVIPVFPLAGVILLPRTQLPLNVFEPRYLAMIDAVLSGARLLGIMQPDHPEAREIFNHLRASPCRCNPLVRPGG